MSHFQSQQKKQKERSKFGRKWSEVELSKFWAFLSLNESFLKSNLEKNQRQTIRTVKKNDFFKRMVQYIGGSKTATQCKNKYYKKEYEILRYLKLINSFDEYFSIRQERKKKKGSKVKFGKKRKIKKIQLQEEMVETVPVFSDQKIFPSFIAAQEETTLSQSKLESSWGITLAHKVSYNDCESEEEMIDFEKIKIHQKNSCSK